MSNKFSASWVVFFCLLGACDSKPSASEREPPPVKDTVFGDMVGTMDKARAVQDTTLKQKEELDREIDKSERDSTESAP